MSEEEKSVVVVKETDGGVKTIELQESVDKTPEKSKNVVLIGEPGVGFTRVSNSLSELRKSKFPTDCLNEVVEVDKTEQLIHDKHLPKLTPEGAQGFDIERMATYNAADDAELLVMTMLESPVFKEKNIHNTAVAKLTKLLFQLKGRYNPENYNSVIIRPYYGRSFVFLNEARKGRKCKFSLFLDCYRLHPSVIQDLATQQ
jgi:hypothetical protein